MTCLDLIPTRLLFAAKADSDQSFSTAEHKTLGTALTIRRILNRKRRRNWLILLAGFALLVFALLSPDSPGRLALLGAGLLMFVGGIAYSALGNRCPLCRGRMGAIIFQYGLSQEIKYCPFCGASLDTEYDELK